MSTHNQHGPRGAMDLRYRFKESSSGHTDSTWSAKLRASADGRAIVLEVFEDHNNMYQPKAGGREQHYEIDPKVLEDFIVAQGKRVK